MFVFIFFISALVLSYVYWIHRLGKNLDLPAAAPNTWPIIGCAHEFIGKSSKDLLKTLYKYGEIIEQNDGIIHSYIGPYLIFAVTDPDDCITVLNTCLEKSWAYDIAKAWLGEGLITVTSNLSLWRHHRRIIARAFNPHVLDSYLHIFNEQAQYLVNDMTSKVETGPFDQSDFLEDWGFKTMFQTTMGFTGDEDNSADVQNCKEALMAMSRIITQRFGNCLLLSPFIYNFTSLKNEEELHQAALHRTSMEIINRKRLALQNTTSKPKKFQSFLDLILELPPQEAFTEREIRDEVETMIVAGSDTSTTALSFCLLLLGAHQDIQDKVYEEIKEVCGSANTDVEKQHLSKLKFLEAVLLETIRLYPFVAITMRKASTDVKLRTCTVPAGTTVLVLVYQMHRSKEHWGSDADEFVPQRWLPVAPPAARAFAGFSIGQRGCIGKVYAMMSMKTVLVHLLRHFRITADISNLKCSLDTFLKPESGCEIALQPRNQ